MRGIPNFPMSRFVTKAKPPRGTIVAMVGILASCQPIPVLITSAPAISISLARCSTSSQELPPTTKSNMLNLYIIKKSGPTASRMRLTISLGNWIRFSKLPPHLSVLWFVSDAINSLIKYPSDPITSTPLYPALLAKTAVFTKSFIVLSTPLEERALGLNLFMGALIAEGATLNGV